MADIVGRDDLTPGSVARSRSSHRAIADRGSQANQPPRTDVGTLLLHWVTAIAFVVSLFTGIRIAADALHAPVSKWLSPVLPQGQIWTFHFYAGLTLFFCAAAYFVYMRRAALFSRNALKKTRLMVMPVASKMRFGGLNVLLHWAAYLIVGIMTITGIFLYLGHGGWLVQVHSYVAFIGLGYIFIHALAHYLYGGWWQLFRVFRPARLVLSEAVKPKPLMIAAGIGALVVAGIAASDTIFQDKLVVRRVVTTPDPSKLLADPVWASVTPVRIHTQ